jgi:hypothetical protein
MKRTAGACVLLAALGGCTTMDYGPGMGAGSIGCGGRGGYTAAVPGVQGPWGQPVAMAAPYSADPPGAAAAKAMMARSLPLDMLHMRGSGPSSPIQQASYVGSPTPPNHLPTNTIAPPGVPFQPILPASGQIPGAVAAVGALPGGGPSPYPCKRTEIRFVAPVGMRVSWYAPSPNGMPGFTTASLEVPGRYNFLQGAIYRLKLSLIRNNVPLELYPTLQVLPSNAQTDAFVAHSAVPVAFTEEDFEQIAAGNFLVKVIYLPFPQFQDFAVTGPDEIVSTRLEPGVDPIAEAARRGNILLIVRVGNIDLEAANTPAMDAPGAYMPKPGLPMGLPGHGMAPGMPGHGMMMPPGAGMAGAMPLGPGMPMMMGPNGPAGGQPGPQPAPMLPPANGTQPTGPAGMLPAPPAGVPVSQVPSAAALQQVQYKQPPAPAATPAQLASQRLAVTSGVKAAEPVKKTPESSKKTTETKRWWWSK